MAHHAAVELVKVSLHRVLERGHLLLLLLLLLLMR